MDARSESGVCFMKNERNQGVMPKNHFLFACL